MGYLVPFFLFILSIISTCYGDSIPKGFDIFGNYSLNDDIAIQELRNSMKLFFDNYKNINDVRLIWESLLEFKSHHQDFRPFSVYQATEVVSKYLYNYSVNELDNMKASGAIPSCDNLLLLATWSSTFIDSFKYWKDIYSQIYLKYSNNEPIFVTSLYCFLQAKYLILNHTNCNNSKYNMFNIIRSSPFHLFPPEYTIVQKSYIPHIMDYFKYIDQAYPTVQYIIFKSLNSYTDDLTDFKLDYVDPLLLSLYNIVPFDNLPSFRYSHYFDILKRQIREIFMNISSSKVSDINLSHIHSWAIGLNSNSNVEYSFFQHDTRLDLISWFNENDVVSFMMWLGHNIVKTFVKNNKHITNNSTTCINETFLQLHDVKNRYLARYELATVDLKNVIKTKCVIELNHPECISLNMQYERVIKILKLRSGGSGLIDDFSEHITPSSRNSSAHEFERFLTENVTCVIENYNMSFNHDFKAFIDYNLLSEDLYASEYLYSICRLLETTTPIYPSVPFRNETMLLPIYFDMMSYESGCNDTVSMESWKIQVKKNIKYMKRRVKGNQPLGWDMRYIRAACEEAFRLDASSLNLIIWNRTITSLSYEDVLVMIQSISSYYLYVDDSLKPALISKIETYFKSMFEFCEIYAPLYQFDQWVRWKSVLKDSFNLISTNISMSFMNVANSVDSLKTIQEIYRESYPLFEKNSIISKKVIYWGIEYHKYFFDSKAIYSYNDKDDPFGLWLLCNNLGGNIIASKGDSEALMSILQNFTAKFYDLTPNDGIAIYKWLTFRDSLVKTYSRLFLSHGSKVYRKEYNNAYISLRDCKSLNTSDYDAWIDSPILSDKHKQDFCRELERISDTFYKNTILLEILEKRDLIEACGKISDLNFITDSIENDCHNECYSEIGQKIRDNPEKLIIAVAEKFASCMANILYSMLTINLSSRDSDERSCVPDIETVNSKILSNTIKFLSDKNLLTTKYWHKFSISVYRKIWIWYHRMIKIHHKHHDETYWDIKQIQFISNISVDLIDKIRLGLCRSQPDRFEYCFMKLGSKINDMATIIAKYNEIIHLRALQDIHDLLNDDDVNE